MFKNRAMQVTFVKKDDVGNAQGAETDKKPLSEYNIGSQVIVIGGHLTKGVIAVVTTYMLCDTIRKIAINNLSR